MADCDVDAANLYLLLHPEKKEIHPFFGLDKARIDAASCTACGECQKVCRFDAIGSTKEGLFKVDPISCEGCGVCSLICPVEAIQMEPNKSGEFYVSDTANGTFVHAKLGIGEENSGKLVTEVKKKAVELAGSHNLDLVIVDGPPGIGCPVIASLTGADLALAVTEPTPSGIHDMQRVIHVARHFKIPAACCINKFDLNQQNSDQIQDWCEKNSVPVVGKIPFDKNVTESLRQRKPFVEYSNGATAKKISSVWDRLENLLLKRSAG
jgi:MinD superfamily P-loop ATPase